MRNQAGQLCNRKSTKERSTVRLLKIFYCLLLLGSQQLGSTAARPIKIDTSALAKDLFVLLQSMQCYLLVCATLRYANTF